VSEPDAVLIPDSDEDLALREWELVIDELRTKMPPQIKSSYTQEELDAMSDEEIEALIKTLEEAEGKDEEGG
jgi:hypothetical protein